MQGERKHTLQHLPEESQTPLTCYCLVCSHVFVCGSLFFYLAPFQCLIFSLSLSAFTQLLLQAHAFMHTNTRSPKLRAQTFFSALCVYHVQVCMSSFPHFSVFQPRLCKNIMPPLPPRAPSHLDICSIQPAKPKRGLIYIQQCINKK